MEDSELKQLPPPPRVVTYASEVDRLLGEKGWSDWLSYSMPNVDLTAWELPRDDSLLERVQRTALFLSQVIGRAVRDRTDQKSNVPLSVVSSTTLTPAFLNGWQSFSQT